jgi:hypothetical protein
MYPVLSNATPRYCVALPQVEPSSDNSQTPMMVSPLSPNVPVKRLEKSGAFRQSFQIVSRRRSTTAQGAGRGPVDLARDRIRREEVHGPPGLGPVSATCRPIPGGPDAPSPYGPVRALGAPHRSQPDRVRCDAARECMRHRSLATRRSADPLPPRCSRYSRCSRQGLRRIRRTRPTSASPRA